MNEPTTTFDDPTLKRALGDLAAGHTAPLSLRERVARQMAAEPVEAAASQSPADGSKRSAAREGRRQFLMKIAAVLLIGIGGGAIAYQLYEEGSPSVQSGSGSSAYSVPGLWSGMVAMQELHDLPAPTSPPSVEPLKASLSDPLALAAEASARLKRRVPAPVFGKEGWTVDSASFCTIAGFDSVAFHLNHDGKNVTVISMPGAAWTAPATDHYSRRCDDHAIAGYVKDGGLHCVVGDHGSSIADVDELVQALRVQ